MNLEQKQNFEIIANLKILNQVKQIKDIDLKLLIKTINKKIAYYYDRSHIISHYHLSTLINKKEYEAIFELSYIFRGIIIPLLKEYFLDDWDLIREILGDNKKEEKFQIINKTIKNEICIYKINEKALMYKETYIKIYE